MEQVLPWLIIAVLFTFGFVYAPLRNRKPLTAVDRRNLAVAGIAALMLAVIMTCALAFR